MGRWILCLLLVKVCLVRSQLFYGLEFPTWPNDGKNSSASDEFKDLDSKLNLSPFIESGEVWKARRLAKVDSKHFLNVTSFSGYLTVDKGNNSNLWFWFFPAENLSSLYEGEDEEDNELNRARLLGSGTNISESAPLILWLQGGPGSSSLFGLFTENGPFFVNDDLMTIRKNPYSWHRNYSILFIDNPVGTGFSYTDPKGYTTSIKQVSEHLHIGLIQFFKLFEEYQSSPFFIAGESFAGKYIPGIGHEIHVNNKKYDDEGRGEFKINLKGLLLGNALSDPINMMDFSSFAFENGLVDIHGKREMQIFEILAKENIDSGRGKLYWDAILYSFTTNSNYSNLYNILEPKHLNLDVYVNFVTQDHIRNALHVGKQEFAGIYSVYVNLIPDFLTSAVQWLRTILDESDVRVLYYSGNKDFIVAYPLSVNFYRRFEWSGAKDYRAAKRQSLFVNGKLGGYFKKAKNFCEAVILNAGHMVPTDQPEVTLEMLHRFISNKL